MSRAALLALLLALHATACPDPGSADEVGEIGSPETRAQDVLGSDHAVTDDGPGDSLEDLDADVGADEVGPEPDLPTPLDAAEPPTIAGLTPTDGTTDVAADASVSVILSGPAAADLMVELTLESYPSGDVISGALTSNPDAYSVTFTPHAPLAPAATYRARATVGEELASALFTIAPLTAPPLPPLAAASKDGLGDTIAAALAGGPSGATFGGRVLDLTTGEVVFDQDGEAPMIPASNTKIFTTAAAMGLLGEDYRFLARAYGDGAVGGDGTLDGDLYLHGQHDITWSHWFYPSPRFPLDVLADRLWDAGLRHVAGGVALYGAYCYEPHHFASYNPATHRAKVEQAFMEALAARGITVQGDASSHATMSLPPGETELARWESLPLWVAIWAVNRKSHNEMADALNRHIGWMIGGSSDYVTGSQAVIDWLAAEGFPTSGLALNDGSGLSTANRISARQLTELYGLMASLPEGPAWKTSLSVGGGGGPASTDSGDVAIVLDNSGPYNGTLAGRMTGADVAGRFFGKSGTNAGITTSGVLWHRHDGRRYAIGLEMNAITSAQYSAARATQDSIIASVAANFRDVGPRPAAPTLWTVEADPVGRAVTATWEAVAGAEGYLVRRSSGASVYTQKTSFTAIGVEPSQARHFAVASIASDGLRSPWSDMYGARVGSQGAARVLVVDANDRWQSAPTDENDVGASHAFIERYVTALQGVTVVSAADEAVEMVTASAPVDAIFWAAGEDSTEHESISAAQQAWLQSWLDEGAALFVSGAEIGYDLSSGADLAFYNEALHATYLADDSGVYVARPTPGGLFDGLGLAGFWTPGSLFVAWSDVIAPGPGGAEALTYASGGAAAVAWGGSVVVFGFPFESVDLATTRQAMMEAVLGYFGL